MKRTLMLSTAAIALVLAIPAAYSQERAGSGNDVRTPAAQSHQRSGAAERATTGQAAPNAQRAGANAASGAAETRESARSEAPATRSEGSQAREQATPSAQQRSQSEPRRDEKQERAQAPRNTEPNNQKEGRNAQDTTSQRAPSQARQGSEKPNRAHNAQRNNEKSAAPARQRAQDQERNGERNNRAAARPEADHQRASENNRDRSRAERRPSERTNVRISERERTRISTTFSHLHVRPLTRVNFAVSVGVVIPGSVRLEPLPAEIVAIVPQYRGYDFVLVRDEIAIVEPRTHKIVEVLPYSGSERAQAPESRSRERVSLSDDQRRTVRSKVITRETTAVAPSSEITIGEELPSTVVVQEFPQTVYESVPTLRSYRYVVRDQDVYLIDPTSRRVIEEIR